MIVTKTFYSQRTCGSGFSAFAPKSFKMYQEKFEKLKSLLHPNGNDSYKLIQPNGTIIVPVAVHFPEANENDRACLEKLAQLQVDILNNDYRSENSDKSKWNTNWSSPGNFYPGTYIGGLDLKFVIATFNHPKVSGIRNGQKLITIGNETSNFTRVGALADSDPQYAGYLNILVKSISFLGYAPLGGDPTTGEATTIDNNSFGTGSGCPGIKPNAPYNFGRTLTHELGHYFRLRHTFIDQSANATDCSPLDEDGINDTPKHAAPTFGSPIPGTIDSCESGKKVLSVNYMDYTDDLGMYMFTKQQAEVSLSYLNMILPFLKTDVFDGIPDLTPPVKIEPFSIYPNPASDIVNIRFSSNKNVSVKIFNILGDLVYNKSLTPKLNSLAIATDNFSKGIYIINVTQEDTSIVKKLIIK